MNTYIFWIIFIVLFVVLFKKKEYFKTCNFKAKGENKSDCASQCIKDGCDVDTCFSICDQCDNRSLCNWVPPKLCEYEPKGSNVIGCVDECLGLDKFKWGGDVCNYKVCKNLCETCQDSTRCQWLNPSKNVAKCEFSPWGPDKQACVDRCVSDDRVSWGGSLCDSKECEKICDSCDDKIKCKWKKYEKDENYLFTKDLPPAQQIRVIPGNQKVKIEWYVKENNDIPNTGYLVYYFKSFKPFEGLTMKSVDKSNGKTCSFNLNNLENNENYSFSVVAINSNGKSPKSNIIDVLINSNKILT